MQRSLNAIAPGSIVVLHACCHNPTGVDLDQEQWGTTLEIVRSRGLIPFLDLAYQGFAESLEADAYAARLFAEAMTPVFLSSSFSKSFSLYGERVGALSVVTGSPEEAMRVLSNLKRVVRTNYSNPPTPRQPDRRHRPGKPAAAAACGTASWAPCAIASRPCASALVDGIHKRAASSDFSFVLKQRGMFSYSGLTKEQVRRLRENYSIYTIDTGRICVAALTSKNVDYVADAIAEVIR